MFTTDLPSLRFAVISPELVPGMKNVTKILLAEDDDSMRGFWPRPCAAPGTTFRTIGR